MYELKITQGTHIFLAIPSYDGNVNNWTLQGVTRLQRVCQAYGIQLTLDLFSGSSLIEVSRNKIVRHFLESKATHLMMVDADVGFLGEDILKLIGHDKDIICGIYPRKKIIWDNVKMAIKHYGLGIDNELLEHLSVDYAFKAYESDDSYTELMQIHFPSAIPTGFLCIKRLVLEKMFDKMRSILTDGQELREFFHVDAEGSREIEVNGIKKQVPEHVSEDFFFCHRAYEHEFEIWMDPSINLVHTGSYTFRGSLKELAKLDKIDRESLK